MGFSVYLPVAGNAINVFLLLGLGGIVGFLSGLFGVGGGFLLTPMLIKATWLGWTIFRRGDWPKRWD